ncbi:MAG: chemotaxis protein CheW [Candidatus Loosdrechtia sp.]|uniref:chemotaxis protein CheA n=1 Tax=Candidatus Loosdrechtia sp. TaxID=3101272 RepID=UPI003A6ED499|nr:MAG: chemotaxis protein CheA [Candidatus Jettenia sp. AMX2]
MSELNTEMGKVHTKDNELSLDIKEDAEIFLDFLSETSDHLEDSERNILSIEDNPCDYETINAIFRSIHSIKGSAGFLGLNDMQKLSHELETLLDKARKGEISITQEIINISLNSIDALRKLRDNLAIRVNSELGKIVNTDTSPKEQQIDIQPLINTILSLLNNEKKPKKTISENLTGQSKAIDTGLLNRDCGSVIAKKDTSRPGKYSNPSQEQEGEINNPAQIVNIETAKEDTESSEKELLGEILLDKGVITREQLDKALTVKNKRLGEILIEEGTTTTVTVDSALQVQQAQRTSKLHSRTVKVDTVKLDSLFELVGELVVTNTMLNGEIKSIDGNGISKNLSQLTKITKDIQDTVMSMRMVSLKQTFQRMSRLARDVSLRSGKSVKLTLSGEDTELDKNVIEEISDPLVHILRNSIDHGIESEIDRITLGKPKEGSVRLSAFHKGGNIIIEIHDDGRGLQKDKILQKAIERGIVSSQSSLTDNQIYNLIFAPGLSTAEKITSVSGRGVGMDVVKKNIEKLRGKVEITSREGKGTTFSIKLPLTLAIIDGIVADVGNTKYIIPTVSVKELLRPKREDVSTINNQGEVVTIRGNVLSLIRLHKLYHIDRAKTNPWEAIVVVVEDTEGKYCILVDNLSGQQQVVIKSLGDRFKNVKGISGGAILGDGKMGLILDICGIREAFTGR